MKTYPMPTNFDGAKFALRYGLSLVKIPPDFWSSSGLLYVPDNLPDDPPIFEAPDPIIPPPAGLYLHAMKTVMGKSGSKAVTDGSQCYHIVAETEALLSDSWLTSLPLEIGSHAYLMDKVKTVYWDGTKWK